MSSEEIILCLHRKTHLYAFLFFDLLVKVITVCSFSHLNHHNCSDL